MNFSTIHLSPLPTNSGFCQKPASLILTITININKYGGANEKKMCFRTEEAIHPLQDRFSHSDFISINVTSASRRFARGDRALLRHILFSSHYMDIFKNIQNATQIRCVMRLQNSLFTVKNVKLAGIRHSWYGRFLFCMAEVGV